ncbi:PD-(D/E)XK nuclease family protein [Deinococcus roseus]|nr:PD-(D/E)XK nuclease family protein [Deinococcus roseus]
MHTERAYLHACLNAAGSQLHLSRPLFDLKGKSLEGSPLSRMFQSAPALPPPLPVTEVEAGLTGEVGEHVQMRASLELSRQKLQVSGHHGQVQVKVPQNHLWSPSQLVKFGSCRFHWMAEKVLKLLPFPEVEKTLQRATEGTFYHKVLEELLRPHLGIRPNPRTLLLELPGAFERAENVLLENGELPPLPHWPFQHHELLENLKNFVKSHYFMLQGTLPQQLEVPIEHTLQLKNGPFSYRGIVDRIEQTKHGTTVIDYKSRNYISELRRPDGSKLELQLPLYLMAVGGQLGRYLSILNREKHLLRTVGPAHTDKGYVWEDHKKEVMDFLEDTVEQLSQGNFQPTPSESACKYCDYGSLCRVRAGQA